MRFVVLLKVGKFATVKRHTTSHVGTAAPGCPAERSSASSILCSDELRRCDEHHARRIEGEAIKENWPATPARTAEGGCPYVGNANLGIRQESSGNSRRRLAA